MKKIIRSGAALGALACALLSTEAFAQNGAASAPAPTQSAQNDQPPPADAGAAERAGTSAQNPAQNDAGPAAAEANNQEIVVTAQFRAQRLQDTPLAITAVSSGLLQARSQTNIIDIGQFAPNVNLSNAASFNGNAIAAFIRGIGQEQSSFAFEPGVGIYIDDVYYGTTFGAVLDLTDLDRVELLRGPQGTLAGKNSLGGAIKLFSRKPDAKGGGFVEATYGSYDRMEVRGSAGFTVADGLYARVSGVATHRQGFFKELDFGCVNPPGVSPINPPVAAGGIPAGKSSDDCVLGREGGGDVYALRAALRYAPTGSPLEVNVDADMSRNDSEQVATKLTVAGKPLGLPPYVDYRSYFAADPAGGVPFDSRFITGPHSYTNYANYSEAGNFTTIFGTLYQVPPGSFADRPKNSANSAGVVGTIDYDFGNNLSLKSITAYRRAWGTTVNDADATAIDVLKERLRNVHKQFTQELRLNGKVGTLADFTVGGFYYDAHDLAQYRVQIPIFLYDFITHDPVSNRSIAAFGHLEVHATDRLNLIGGLRYTDDKKTYTFHRRNPDGSPVGTIFPPGSPLPLNVLIVGLDGISSTFKGDRLDYRAGVNYRWSSALMTYAQVSTGYKGGGINPQPFVADQVVPFGPEKLTSYEVGFKSDLFDRRLRLNGTAFLSEYKDVQRTVFFCPESSSPSCGETKNVANARYKGIELETFIRPVEGLTIDGSLAYLDAKYTKIINASSGVTIDMRPPFASKWQASAGAEYVVDLGPSGRITPRVDWSYLSSFFYNAVNNPFNLIPGRSLFNARISYETEDRSWTISAAVTNLGDKFYTVGVGENINGLGNADTVLGRPREWSVTVRRRF